ncbi:MAG: hypothetical protein J6C85_00050 [Alphaproteobacteria bacterium]|nr:hypothetical protein [Alphaproteobacteria bacterium]
MNDKNQTGRSMVEMLGVLAIVGILSVSGIAGFQKAMMKHRTNKTFDEIATIAANIQTLFANYKMYEGTATDCGSHNDEKCNDFSTLLDSDLDFLKNAGVFPEGMFVDGKLVNPFNGVVEVSSWEPKFLFIIFEDLPKEACIALVTHNWMNVAYGYVGLSVASEWGNTTPMDCYLREDEDWDEVLDGELNACTWGKTIPHPVPFDIAAQGCNCRTGACKISIQFDESKN